jgi:hypothetical protein
MNGGELTERIELKRFVENSTSGYWMDLIPPTAWAEIVDQGDGNYQVRTRWRPDLHTFAQVEPSLRMRWQGEEHDITNVTETVRRHEVRLTATRRIVKDITHLASGTRRIKAWP